MCEVKQRMKTSEGPFLFYEAAAYMLKKQNRFI